SKTKAHRGGSDQRAQATLLFSSAPKRSTTSPPSLRKSGRPARWRETPAPQKKMTSPASHAIRRSPVIDGQLAKSACTKCLVRATLASTIPQLIFLRGGMHLWLTKRGF